MRGREPTTVVARGAENAGSGLLMCLGRACGWAVPPEGVERFRWPPQAARHTQTSAAAQLALFAGGLLKSKAGRYCLAIQQFTVK